MDLEKRQLIQAIQREAQQATGRRYDLGLEHLGVQQLRGILQLIRDMIADRDEAIRRARLRPW